MPLTHLCPLAVLPLPRFGSFPEGGRHRDTARHGTAACEATVSPRREAGPECVTSRRRRNAVTSPLRHHADATSPRCLHGDSGAHPALCCRPRFVRFALPASPRLPALWGWARPCPEARSLLPTLSRGPARSSPSHRRAEVVPAPLVRHEGPAAPCPWGAGAPGGMRGSFTSSRRTDRPASPSSPPPARPNPPPLGCAPPRVGRGRAQRC